MKKLEKKLLEQEEQQLIMQSSNKPVTTSDPAELLHNLQVHQIELEMQNQELQAQQRQIEDQNKQLIATQAELSEALAGYTKLYDYAPSAYFTLAADSRITQANFAAARLFRMGRPELYRSQFLTLVRADLQQEFSAFLEKTFNSYVEQRAEFILEIAGQPVYIKIEANVEPNREFCQLLVFDITERKLAEQEKIQGDLAFRSLAEAMPQIVWITDANGLKTYINQQWINYTGLSLAESYGEGWNKAIHPEDRQRTLDAWQNAMAQNQTYAFECRLRRADGVYQWWLIRGVPVINQKGKVHQWFGTCTDIEDIKQAEKQLLRLNRLYKVISAINYVIVHTKDRNIIFQEFCRVIVEQGGFHLAWIGLLDPESGLLAVTAASGETGYLEGIRVSVNIEPEGLGPTGTAVREGRYCICNDFVASATTRPWHDRAIAFGMSASASIAIRQGQEVIGALTLYADEKDYFDAQQEELLQQIGIDISFALDTLILEARIREVEILAQISAERERASVAIRNSEARLRFALETIHTGAWELNLEDHTSTRSVDHDRIFGYPYLLPEWTYEIFLKHVLPEDRPEVDAKFQKAIASHGEWRFECRIRRVDGEIRYIFAAGRHTQRGENSPLLMAGIVQDITERKLAELALRDREHELQLIMNSTPALLSYIDTDFRYVRVNASYQNWFCTSPDQVIGHKCREIIGEKAWQTLQPLLEKAKRGERVSFDQQITYGNGKPRWVHGSYIPDKDPEGTIKGIVVHIVDIDELKQAEAALRESQQENQFLADLIRSSSQPLGIAYADGRVGLVNCAFEELTGYSANELQQLDWRTGLTPPEWFDLEQAKLKELNETGVPARYEKEYIRKDGTRVPIELLVQIVRDAENKPLCYSGFLTDITERKRAEQALRSSEAFVRNVLNSLPEHIVALDKQGVVVAVNEPWERFAEKNNSTNHNLSLGANYLEVCQKSSAAGDPDAQQALNGLEALLAGRQEEFVMEYICAIPNQKLCFLMHAKRMAYGSEGVIVTHLDITGRRHAEDELRKALERLNLIVGAVNAGFWDWDLNTSELYLSAEWKRQIGYDDEEFPNQWDTWINHLHADDRDEVMAATKNFIAGYQAILELQYRLRHKDGTHRWIHTRGVLLYDGSQRPTRMLGINLDVTDFIKSKEINERRNKMEQSFRFYVASQTAAAIAHEINQPLTAIGCYADVALNLVETGNPDTQKLCSILNNCSQQAERAGHAIRQLMGVLQKGEVPSELVDINQLVRDTVDLLKLEGRLKEFTVDLKLTPELPLVMANVLQVQKILLNVLQNALESMQDAGSGVMTVTTRRSDSNLTMAQVTVCDSGKGVNDEPTLKKLFQPFYTTKSTGLGMGLAISRALIESHGGKMWAEPNPDQGLSIQITLPFSANPEG